MAKSLDIYITSLQGVDYRFEVYDDNYASSAIEVPANDFELVYTPANDWLNCPIITSELTLTIYDDGTSGVGAIITSIEASDEPEIRVVMSVDEGSGYSVYWVGIVEKQSLVRMNEPKPTSFTLRASDGLSRLKDIRYPGIANGTHTGSSTLAQFIVECLSENGLSGLWGTSDPYLLESIEWVSNEVDTPTASSSPLLYTRCNVLNFRENLDNAEPINSSCYDVIWDIMLLLGAQFMHAKGGYIVRQPRNFDSTTHTERRITKLLAVTSATVSNSASRIAASTSSSAGYFHILAGGEFRRLDPLDKVRAIIKPRVLVNMDDSTHVVNAVLNNGQKSFDWTIPLGNVRKSTGDYFEIYFKHNVLQKGRWEWRVTITITLPGSPAYYLAYNAANNEFSWSTTSSSYIVIRRPDKDGDFVVMFRTPEVPVSSSTGATLYALMEYWDRGTAAQPTNVGNQVIWVWRPEVKLKNTTKLVDSFEREVDNGLTDTNSRVLDLGAFRLNDTSTLLTVNSLEINSTGTTWVNAETWDAGFDTDVSLTASAMLEHMSYQQTAIEGYRGGTEGFMRPHLSIIYDSKTWVMTRFTWRGKFDEAWGEWWQLSSALTGIDIGDERETDNVDDVFKLRTPIEQEQHIDSKWKLEKIGYTTNTDDVGTSISQINLLNAIGHDNVVEGDTLAIVHPLTGEILDEYVCASTAGGGDNSITVTAVASTHQWAVGYLVMHKRYEVTSSDVIRGEQFVMRGELGSGDAKDESMFLEDSGMIMHRQTSARVSPIGELISRTSLSQAQIQALHTTPVEVVASPGSGKYLEVVRAMVKYDHNGTSYTGSTGSCIIEYDTSENSAVSYADVFLEEADANIILSPGAPPHPYGSTADFDNNGLQIKNSTPLSSAGGTAEVVVYYRIITI